MDWNPEHSTFGMRVQARSKHMHGVFGDTTNTWQYSTVTTGSKEIKHWMGTKQWVDDKAIKVACRSKFGEGAFCVPQPLNSVKLKCIFNSGGARGA